MKLSHVLIGVSAAAAGFIAAAQTGRKLLAVFRNPAPLPEPPPPAPPRPPDGAYSGVGAYPTSWAEGAIRNMQIPVFSERLNIAEDPPRKVSHAEFRREVVESLPLIRQDLRDVAAEIYAGRERVAESLAAIGKDMHEAITVAENNQRYLQGWTQALADDVMVTLREIADDHARRIAIALDQLRENLGPGPYAKVIPLIHPHAEPTANPGGLPPKDTPAEPTAESEYDEFRHILRKFSGHEET